MKTHKKSCLSGAPWPSSGKQLFLVELTKPSTSFASYEAQPVRHWVWWLAEQIRRAHQVSLGRSVWWGHYQVHFSVLSEWSFAETSVRNQVSVIALKNFHCCWLKFHHRQIIRFSWPCDFFCEWWLCNRSPRKIRQHEGLHKVGKFTRATACHSPLLKR